MPGGRWGSSWWRGHFMRPESDHTSDRPSFAASAASRNVAALVVVQALASRPWLAAEAKGEASHHRFPRGPVQRLREQPPICAVFQVEGSLATLKLSQQTRRNHVGGYVELRKPAKPACFPYIVPNELTESREIHAIQATRSRPLVSAHYRDDNACRSHGVESTFDVWRAMRMQRVAAVTVMTVLGRHGLANVAAFSRKNAACGTGSKIHFKDAALAAPEVNI